MRIDGASAKRRNAGPGDYASVRTIASQAFLHVAYFSNPWTIPVLQDIGNEELRSKVWAGVIPVEYRHGTPQPTEYNQVEGPKDYWKGRPPA